MGLNKDEELILWQMSKISKNLVDYYRNLLNHDVDDSWGEETLDLLKKERKKCKQILNELDNVLNNSSEINKSDLETLVVDERDSEKVERELEQLSNNNKLEMAGNKGLKYIKSLEEFTEFLIGYEKLKADSIDRSDSNVTMKSEISTKNTDYICAYQSSHQKYNNFSEEVLKQADAYVLEGASNKPITQLTVDDFFENPVRRQKDEDSLQPAVNSELLFRNQEFCKPIYLGDVAPKNLNDKDLDEFGRVDYVVERIKQTPTKHAAVGGIVFPSATLISGLSVSAALVGSLVSITPAYIGLIANFLASKGIKLQELTIVQMLDPATARSAIIAEKMETIISGQIKEAKGGKPKIMFNYGAGHFDIELFLKYPKLRRMTLAIHKSGNFPALDSKEVNKIVRFDFSSNESHHYQNTFNGEKFELSYSKYIGEADIL